MAGGLTVVAAAAAELTLKLFEKPGAAGTDDGPLRICSMVAASKTTGCSSSAASGSRTKAGAVAGEALTPEEKVER